MRQFAPVLLSLSLLPLAGCDQPPPSRVVTELAPAAEPAVTGDNRSERRALFGDLHVHSSWSLDGYIFGNNNDPRDA